MFFLHLMFRVFGGVLDIRWKPDEGKKKDNRHSAK